MRKLRMKPEYGTGSVWDDDWNGESEICPRPSTLGASAELQADFEAWERVWEATFDPEHPPDGGFASDEDRVAFNIAGERLAERLQTELGPGVEIRFVPMGPDSLSGRGR